MEYELLHTELKIQSTNKGSSGYSYTTGSATAHFLPHSYTIHSTAGGREE